MKEVDMVVWRYVEVFCSFNCVFAELREKLLKFPTFFNESLTLLSEIFEECTDQPFNSLQPSNDRRLLKKWNGHMDYEQYHSNPGYYASIPSNYFFTPCLETLTKNL